MRGGRAHSLSLSSPLSQHHQHSPRGGGGGTTSGDDGGDPDGGGGEKMNEEALKALRSWVKESLVDSKERNERGGYYELLDAFSSMHATASRAPDDAPPIQKIDESLVALVDALAEHATYVEYRAHEHLLECITLEKCSTVSLRTVDDAYYCLLYTSPSPRDQRGSRMPSSA